MRAKVRTKVRRRETRSGVRWYVSAVDATGAETAHGGYRTRREALSVAGDLTTDSRRGKYVKPSERTLADYLLREWLPARENSRLSETTRDTDRTVAEAWILPHLGQIPLQEISARHLDDLYLTLRSRGGRGGRPLRGKSVRNAHVTLSKALGDAVRRGHLTINPVLAVDPPARDDSVSRDIWDRQQVVRFLGAAESDRLGAIWRLALASGLRRGELLGLSWEDLSLSERTISVSRQVLVRPRAVSGKRRVYVRGTTKSRRVRLVRFDATTEAWLRRWKAAQGRERLAFGSAWKDDGGVGEARQWVVTEPDGSVIHPETLLGRWARVAREAEVPAIGLHGARHSYATLALEAGVRLDVVSSQLGHSSVATTANIYAHVTPAAGADAAERIGALLAGAGE